MGSSTNQFKQVEGQWDEIIQHPEQFAGQRVRITVLPVPKVKSFSQDEIRRWFAEGRAIEITPPNRTKPDLFGDILVEKFRKQGLEL